MPRFVYNTAVSITGHIADPDNSLDWLFAVEQDPDVDDHAEFMERIGVCVYGATTYEWVLAATGALADPAQWEQVSQGRPVVLFTHRDLPVPAGADVRVVSGAVADALPAVIAAAGDRDVWLVGGGDLVGQFDDADALDEIQLSVAPAALTGGAPVLPRTIGADRLRLRSAAPQGQFARLVYDVRRPAR